MKHPTRYLLGFTLMAAAALCAGRAVSLSRTVRFSDMGYLAENAMDGRVECRDTLEADGDWYTLYRADGGPAWCVKESK